MQTFNGMRKDRLSEEEKNRILLLRQAIADGIKSGFVENFDSVKHKEILNKNWQLNSRRRKKSR